MPNSGLRGAISSRLHVPIVGSCSVVLFHCSEGNKWAGRNVRHMWNCYHFFIVSEVNLTFAHCFFLWDLQNEFFPVKCVKW
jgi:hypothetical protein